MKEGLGPSIEEMGIKPPKSDIQEKTKDKKNEKEKEKFLETNNKAVEIKEKPLEEVKKEIETNPEIQETKRLINEAKKEELESEDIPSLDKSAEEVIKEESTPKSALGKFFQNTMEKLKNFYTNLSPDNKKRLKAMGVVASITALSAVTPLALPGIVVGGYLFFETLERLILDLVSKGKHKPLPST